MDVGSPQNINKVIREYSDGQWNDFNEFYENLNRPIRAHLYHMVGQKAVDDLTQEVFVKAWKALPNFRAESSLKTWIYKIATHVAIDYLRATKNEKLEDQADETRIESQENLESQNQYQNLVKMALGKLDPVHRSTFSLYVFEELSVAEIAKVLGVPEGTVKSRLSTARKTLQEVLTKEGINL